MPGPAISIRDVAFRAGVSVGTVSNVLNRPDIVAAGTRSRVLAAISELGFVPNDAARQLRRGRGRTLGLVVLDVANPFFTDVARGVEEATSTAGMPVIFCNSDGDAAKENAYLDLLEEQRVQGVLITPVDDASERLLQLRERGVLVVLLDRRSRRPDLCSVSVNDRLGGELAVRHLIDAGHRRIAFVGGPTHLEQVRDRYAGAAAALVDAGLSERALRRFDTPSLTVAAGRDAAARVLGVPRSSRVTAVFCANDLLALGVLQGLTRQQVRVPENIALVGYDDIDFAAAAAVPLSSVRQPRQRLGHTAATLLLDEAASPGTHRHEQVVFDPELVVRESSQDVRAPRPEP
ncbi:MULTISPECIES: LacI family DNA-binding transcriptional regulator [unclassified Solwaraspora]|uniref:LacI family DNA-binding transcriptional regulator n=1 Tax=unclassified Solwaraspora TaxID=2627926 RepID=UPI00259BB3A7|nr:substrate-binding domain-containing protein [Solwaraspora sp. WMMA2056]WJK39748.1 substrate-binding domain-containing protein [Solwaraspora sp. WMMA2056]